jgi:GNAT superfamily N-acetyltransferase
VVTIDEAIQIFGKGFTYTRSFTHPYLFSKMEDLWVMHDGPRTRGGYRGKEAVVWGLAPEVADRQLRKLVPDAAVCVLDSMSSDFSTIADSYKALGYRLIRREPLMVRPTQYAPERISNFPVRRVLTQDEADAVTKSARSRQILPIDLSAPIPKLRLYAAYDGSAPIGWVRSIVASPSGNWVSNMFVVEKYRRQGIAASLISAMLKGDEESGAKNSVLLSSHTGTKLYRSIGYEQLGLLQLFVRR